MGSVKKIRWSYGWYIIPGKREMMGKSKIQEFKLLPDKCKDADMLWPWYVRLKIKEKRSDKTCG